MKNHVEHRTKSTLKCIWCREEFEGFAFSKFCSNRCKQADKYALKKGTHRRCIECETTFRIVDDRVKRCDACRGKEDA